MERKSDLQRMFPDTLNVVIFVCLIVGLIGMGVWLYYGVLPTSSLAYHKRPAPSAHPSAP